jgi:4-hydroxybenzoate polyprenyltransferase
VLYNVSFRRRAIADVIAISLGFVLRAIAGGVAIGVPVSVWLVVCTFMLCLFLGLIKRRAEVAALGERAVRSSPRAVHAFYTMERLDHMLGVSAGLAVVTYTLYCLVSPHSPGVHMIWTIPVVMYGMFRMYSLAVGTQPTGPVDLLKRDGVLWAVAAVWAGMVVAVMQMGHHPWLHGWLSR